MATVVESSAKGPLIVEKQRINSKYNIYYGIHYSQIVLYFDFKVKKQGDETVDHLSIKHTDKFILDRIISKLIRKQQFIENRVGSGAMIETIKMKHRSIRGPPPCITQNNAIFPTSTFLIKQSIGINEQFDSFMDKFNKSMSEIYSNCSSKLKTERDLLVRIEICVNSERRQ